MILQDANKTLDDITEEYKEKFEEKSRTTIYRYLKSYIKKGFIIESGRIIKGKKHTAEKLFATNAKIFFIDNQYLDAWEQGKRSLVLASKICVIAQRRFNDKWFDFEILKEFLRDYEYFIQSTAFQALKNVQEKHPEIGKEIFSLDNDEKLVFFSILKNSFFYLTKGKFQEFKNRLDEIFVQKPIDLYKLIAESMKESEKYSELKIAKPEGYQTDSYTRKMVHFTDYSNYTKYMLDINYGALLLIFSLNDNPLSIKAIAEKFPIAYDIEYEWYKTKTSNIDSSGNFDHKKADIKDNKVTENRIYRLIQDLKNDGMVFEAGRQISETTSKTSILYTTTGKRFIYLENRDEFWKHEPKWKNVVQLISKILQIHFNVKNLDESSFYDLFTEIEKLKFDSFKEILANVPNKEITDYYYHSLNAIELNSSINSLGTINVYFQEEDIISIVNTLQNLFFK